MPVIVDDPPKLLELRFNCRFCTGSHPAIVLTIERRDSEQLIINCPLCKREQFTVWMAASHP
jgi:transcription elongation factor Elf1